MDNGLMLKAVSNSKFFFVALGIAVGMIGVRLSAAPSEPKKAADLERSVERIADSLEKIQRDGIKMEVSPKWGSDEFRVKIVQ